MTQRLGGGARPLRCGERAGEFTPQPIYDGEHGKRKRLVVMQEWDSVFRVVVPVLGFRAPLSAARLRQRGGLERGA